MANVLIIDDDELMCRTLCAMVNMMGSEVSYALTLQSGLHIAGSGNVDAVFLDVHMPDGDGLEVLPKILQVPDAPEVIIITGSGDSNGAELAIKAGAWDYVQKPILVRDMEIALLRALQYRQAKQIGRPAVALKRQEIIGSSPQVLRCLDLVAEAANCEANVLITGETGTGKELFAKAIHNNSPRAEKSFVIVDCATLPESLVESMLFGHEKGAFTGADRARQGLIEQADRGTLFLDEVGELPWTVQKSFLRVLQERRFRPLGGRQEIESNFRLVAATNRDLEEMVRNGQFRSDLLFRLRTVSIDLPPLRDRSEDIFELTLWHIARLSEHYGSGTKGVSPEFGEMLTKYDWPGNVRELLNAIERAIAAARHEPVLFHRHLPTYVRVHIAQSSLSSPPPIVGNEVDKALPVTSNSPSFREFRKAAIDELERKYLTDLMTECKGKFKKACEIAGLSRTRLYGLLSKHKIPPS